MPIYRWEQVSGLRARKNVAISRATSLELGKSSCSVTRRSRATLRRLKLVQQQSRYARLSLLTCSFQIVLAVNCKSLYAPRPVISQSGLQPATLSSTLHSLITPSIEGPWLFRPFCGTARLLKFLDHHAHHQHLSGFPTPSHPSHTSTGGSRWTLDISCPPLRMVAAAHTLPEQSSSTRATCCVARR